MKTLQRGVSFVEVAVVIAIVALLAVLSFASLSGIRGSQLLQNDAGLIVSVLDDARSRTLSARGGYQYGVHFESDRLVLFQGDGYPGSAQETVLLNPGVELSEIALTGGGADVIFKKLSGATEQFGTLVLNLRSDASQKIIITIYASGLVEAG